MYSSLRAWRGARHAMMDEWNEKMQAENNTLLLEDLTREFSEMAAHVADGALGRNDAATEDNLGVSRKSVAFNTVIGGSILAPGAMMRRRGSTMSIAAIERPSSAQSHHTGQRATKTKSSGGAGMARTTSGAGSIFMPHDRDSLHSQSTHADRHAHTLGRKGTTAERMDRLEQRFEAFAESTEKRLDNIANLLKLLSRKGIGEDGAE
eukprot:Opistho-2@35686